jgi:hypothetical protein
MKNAFTKLYMNSQSELERGVRYRLADIERSEADAEVRQPAATIGGAT